MFFSGVFTDFLLERLHAIVSPWSMWICDIEDRYIHTCNGLGSLLNWDTTRARSFQCIAQMAYCCHHIADEPGPPSFDMISRWLAECPGPSVGFGMNLTDVLKSIKNIASDTSVNMGFSLRNKLAPVEFVFIGACNVPCLLRSYLMFLKVS